MKKQMNISSIPQIPNQFSKNQYNNNTNDGDDESVSYVIFQNVKNFLQSQYNTSTNQADWFHLFPKATDSCLNPYTPNIDEWDGNDPTINNVVYFPFAGVLNETCGIMELNVATHSNMKAPIPKMPSGVYGMIMGYSDQKDYNVGLSVKVYLKDLHPEDYVRILECVQQKYYEDWYISDEQIDQMFMKLCTASSSSGTTYGNCPLDRNNKTMVVCPNFTKTIDGSMNSGSSICQIYAALTQFTTDNMDRAYNDYCVANPMDYMCDCIAAPGNTGFYSAAYAQILNVAQQEKINLSNNACWFPPCRDKLDRLITSTTIVNDTNCPVPSCINVCINCGSNSDNDIINQVCCSGDNVNNPICKSKPKPPPPPPPKKKTNLQAYEKIFIFLCIAFILYKSFSK